MSKTLIFPYVNEQAYKYYNDALERDEEVVRASSDNDPNRDILFIPTIHSNEFRYALIALTIQFDIKRIYCPVASVYIFMRKFIEETNLDVKLIGKSPIQQEIDNYHALMTRTEKVIEIIDNYTLFSNVNILEVAGILKRTSQIYGESNDEKIAGMIAIFADTPKGDVVEIGSLMGRSAFVLLYLAFNYEIGNVLTIDPYSASEGVQKDSPKTLTDMTNEWDHDIFLDSLFINLIPSRIKDHAHLHMSSDEAFYIYTNEFVDDLTGQISVIHIDGNHDYDRVKSDCDKWTKLILSDGWLILDDYEWAHGDGPKRAGDELLVESKGKIKQHFVLGKALFIQFI